MIRRILAAAGLATAAQVEHARNEARMAAKKAEEGIAKARADAESWKRRQGEAAQSAAEFRKAAERAEAAVERATRGLEQATGEAQEWKARAETLGAELRELRERLEEAKRVATIARQHLMATEVKLDLIEAAVQVLDERTREGALRRP